jgi:hypothetical protein
MLDTSLGGKRSQILSWLLEKEGTFLNARACVLRNLYWHLSLSWSTTQHGQTYVDWHGSSTNQSGGVKDAALLFFVTTSAFLRFYLFTYIKHDPLDRVLAKSLDVLGFDLFTFAITILQLCNVFTPPNHWVDELTLPHTTCVSGPLELYCSFRRLSLCNGIVWAGIQTLSLAGFVGDTDECFQIRTLPKTRSTYR